MKTVFASEAVEDLQAAVQYLANRNPVAAQRLSDRVFKLISQLAENVFDGPEQVLRSGERVRSWPVSPLRVYYQRAADELHILRVYHQRRRPISRR